MANFTDRIQAWRDGGAVVWKRTRILRRRLFIFLAILGPGVITSNVDNDAGGISVYTQAGAQFGYALLWSLIPMTIALYVTEEMCARMGVITGKGLSDLIREEFGFRPTFFLILAGLLVDMGNTTAEFAGVAASMQIFHISKYIAVPIAALIVWVLVLRGTYRQVEKIFLIACTFYFAYLFSAFLAHPNWLEAAKSTVIPSFHMNAGYLLMLTALVGTTIAPWQFFYMQASFVEKRVGSGEIACFCAMSGQGAQRLGEESFVVQRGQGEIPGGLKILCGIVVFLESGFWLRGGFAILILISILILRTQRNAAHEAEQSCAV